MLEPPTSRPHPAGDIPNAPATPGKTFKRWAGWVLGLGLLAVLLSRMPLRDVPRMIAVLPAHTAALAFAGFLCSYVLRAARLQAVLPPLEWPAGTRRLVGIPWAVVKVIFLHNGAINLIPMRAGELTFPWLCERHLGLSKSVALATLVWMRVQDLIVLASLGVFLMPGLSMAWRLGLWAAGMMALGLLRHWARRHEPPSPSSTTLLPALNTVQTVRQALADPTHHSGAAWVFSAANWCVKLWAGGTLLSSLTGVHLVSGLTGALGGELAAVLPVQGPAGLGTYEAGVTLGLHWAHSQAGASSVLAQGSAVWAALILHVMMLCSALCCAALAPWIPTGRRPL